ncbi:MAG TPA: tetratricopeptide repeat protein [Terriglobia bacterium]|nr:tetratricopeptide repeat protein [Terriglobia bacterium]
MAEGLMYLRRATELNPYGSNYWYALGSACDLANDTACADQAFERAIHFSPVVPRFQWGAANHYLVTDRTDKALTYFHRLLQLDPAYAWPTFRLCLRATADPELVYHKVLLPGNDTNLKLTFVTFLSGEGNNVDAARQIWSEALATPSSFPITAAEPYLDRLVILGRGQEARSAWQDLERVGAIPGPDPGDNENLIYNGDFERSPINAGLDWRFNVVPFISVDFSDPGAYHGIRCMRMDFTVGRNEIYVGPFQFVPVDPNREYLLQAYVRSQNITSDSGPRLQVVDPLCPTCMNFLSDVTVGTTPWHLITLKFLTGPKTRLVDVLVLRERGRTFPTEITGSFWMDSVSLKSGGSDSDEVSLRPAH